jgi:hypothetical protein
MPGFPYLGGLSPRIAAPRLQTPRQVVASGTVGIAGCQTGVYPLESPVGWRIIGRTPAQLFDPGRAEPFLISAGDRVRSGFRAFGLSPGGVMDNLASGTANLLVGNGPDAAVLEMTLLGGSFRFATGAYVAVCGADMGCWLNGAPVRAWSAFSVPPGGELTFGHALTGCRSYLAVRGGITVPVCMGSRSTSLREGLFEGIRSALADGMPQCPLNPIQSGTT